MVSWTSCNATEKLDRGNLLDWPLEKLTTNNTVRKTMIDDKEFCNEVKFPNNVVLPGTWTFAESIKGKKH